MSERVTSPLATDAAGVLGTDAACPLARDSARLLGTAAARPSARCAPNALASAGVDRVPDLLLKTQPERADNSDGGLTPRRDCVFRGTRLISRCAGGSLRRGAL